MPLKKRRKIKHNAILWRRLVILALAIILVLGAVIGINRAYNAKRPRFDMHTAIPTPAEFYDDNYLLMTGAIPEPNNGREIAAPSGLRISYELIKNEYAPVFKMDLTDADISKYITIAPFVRGKWTRAGANSLVFIPEQEWPANTKFSVNINRAMFNPDVYVNRRITTFRTPDINANLNSFALYPAPNAAKSMVAVAVVSFNYPIETSEFAKRTSMSLNGKKLEFTVKFDRLHRTAFIISAPVEISDMAQTMRVKVNRIPALNGDAYSNKINGTVTLESGDNFFKIDEISTAVADDAGGDAQQLVLLNMTASAAQNVDWKKFVNIYLLPEDADNNIPHAWANDEITPDVLKRSAKLDFAPVDFANPVGTYQYAFSYTVSQKTDRYIYVSVMGGLDSASGFILKNGSGRVMRVPYPERTVKIAGDGALLPMGGERKLGIVARGGADAAYINLYKVKNDEINHLISQTYDVFAKNIEFKSWSFGVYDMASVFQKKISFADTSMNRTNYASVDLGAYLDRTEPDKTGIFIIQTGATENSAEYGDRRLIILTDLGLIRKENLDLSSSLFVSSLTTGAPVADAEISVLGRNGNAVWVGRTDEGGRANIPALPWAEYKNERTPVAFVARNGDDVSFIPYNAPYEIRNEYSKFDTGGAFANASAAMAAYVFSDRGIYRPGESAIIAGIVKNKEFKPLSGVPVKMEIRDARGRVVLERLFSLAPDGMFEVLYEIPDTATVGEYSINLFSLNAKNSPQDLLGSTSIRVAEFTPDNMKITATISDAQTQGWISPNNIKATVALRNLFGAPAQNRRITADAVLRPTDFNFAGYQDYKFTPNFISGTGISGHAANGAQTFNVTLADTYTDENGNAIIDIDFDRTIPSGTYMLSLNVHGYEGDSGTSVQTITTARVSDAKYLLGYRTSRDLSYVSRASAAAVQIIALDSNGMTTATENLTMRLVRRENLTSLVKDYNGYYKYQTITRDSIISQSQIKIERDGTDIMLDTQNGGAYYVQIMDDDDKILANIEYFVASDENTSLSTERNAELKVRTNATKYAPGTDIEVSITGPYAGTGLITIERDRVYAYKWFKSNGSTSVQHITLPAEFEGTGYINVSFVRDINSSDIFTAPYAYAATPFSVATDAHEIKISLDTPDVIRDGTLQISYQTNKQGRIMIFAVNTGILQVAKHLPPNPLNHFFQKAALQVETYQILSLLLPEYKILREFAKTGGGDYDEAYGEMPGGTLTNPFGRRIKSPVAFYSGIIEAKANTRGQISFEIPEYFNGAVRVFAVAANDSGVGAASAETLVQSPVIITATAPFVAAPGDSFDINAVIANQTPDSGNDAYIYATAHASDNIVLTGDLTTKMNIAPDMEKLWVFGAHAGENPGAAEISVDAALFDANGGEIASRTSTSTISIRPVNPFETTITSGTVNSKSSVIKNFATDFYSAMSSRKLYLSQNAGALARPLFAYLRDYDFPCTEQTTSRVMPYVVAPDNIILGTTFDTSAAQVQDAISILKNRQNDNGSFDLWASGANGQMNPSDRASLTAYVAMMLTLAREQGMNVPNGMLSRAVDYLRTYAGDAINDDAKAHATAMAIYVITANGYVTTNYIDMFEEYADKHMPKWRETVDASYIAASYIIMRQTDRARDLMDSYKLSDGKKIIYESMFRNSVADDAMHMFLMAKYFASVSHAPVPSVARYINSGEYTAYTSAMAIMGLTAGRTRADIMQNISVTADGEMIQTKNIAGIITAAIPEKASRLEIKCPSCGRDNNLFYAISQQGFPKTSETKSNGIEIVREYFDANGNRIKSGTVGDRITVKISARATKADNLSNVAIIDLLPGGFIADGITGDMDFAEIREDRVLIFTNLTRYTTHITYTATLGAAGTFAIPPVHATSMYNPAIVATGTGGVFSVSNEDAQ